VAGVVAVGALLTMAFTVSVRLETIAVNVAATERLGELVADGDAVALCDVPPRVVSPAPAGALTLHDLFFDWSVENALRYRTGTDVTASVATPAGCPDGAHDVVVDFDDLRP
jgi:hypothetical protein